MSSHNRCPCYYLYSEQLVLTSLKYIAAFSLLRQPYILQYLLLKLQTLFTEQDPWTNFSEIVMEVPIIESNLDPELLFDVT